ncbi:MAG: CDGSH iron-sulfur domain-containing protein [Blastocatellia bacterium]|jgi:CDGSH-type Zn-finger protein|nr:CDGSH iron-sulfur domain-containing protein [Blastocatellia bacterium]
MSQELKEVEINCINNGPLRITGQMVIKDGAGNAYGLGGRSTISLCRCGASANKPFCDGAHARAGFESVVEARDLPPPAPKK